MTLQDGSRTKQSRCSKKAITFAVVILSAFVSIFLVFFTDLMNARDISEYGRSLRMLSQQIDAVHRPHKKLRFETEPQFIGNKLRSETQPGTYSDTITELGVGASREDKVNSANEEKGSLNNRGMTFASSSTLEDDFKRRTNSQDIHTTDGERATERLQTGTTVMSFDSKLVVTCKETPFVSCHWPTQKAESNKNTTLSTRVFRISVLRLPPWLSHAHFRFDNCEYSGCAYDKDKVTEETDVVNLYSVKLGDFPSPKRWPHQLYMASCWESPTHAKMGFLSNPKSHWYRNYNLTMSYRTTDDLFVPYGRLKFNPRPVDQRSNYYEIAKKKDKMVAWLVSNCRTLSGRLEYAREMKKYIQLDIYGGCGTPGGKSIMEEIKTRYKFYLAFENSNCRDYITEKFFRFFKQDTHLIQVARGGADYNKYFPKGTFINAADFDSAKDLALHLNDLGKNLTAYSQFLEYKDLYTYTGEGLDSQACKLCKYLHTHKLESKVANMKSWRDCPNPRALRRYPGSA